MALDSQDGLYVWGINQHDSLGFSNKTVLSHPTRLTQLAGIVHFAAGDGFALVVAKHHVQDKKNGRKQDRGKSPRLAFKQNCIDIVKSKIEHLKGNELHKKGILDKIELDHFTKMSRERLLKEQEEGLKNQQPARPRRQNTIFASPSSATI